jgi:hypothetical protein
MNRNPLRPPAGSRVTRAKPCLVIAAALSLALPGRGVAASWPAAGAGGGAATPRAPQGAVTEQFVKDYILREERRSVATDRPPVTVTLAFQSVRIGKPYRYRGASLTNVAEGETITPVRVAYTRTRRSDIRTETGQQAWDYLFYNDAFGEWTHSASPTRQ